MAGVKYHGHGVFHRRPGGRRPAPWGTGDVRYRPRAQFTSEAFTGALRAHGIKISMDGEGRWADNVFVERLWRSVKYGDVYLLAYEAPAELRPDWAVTSCFTTPDAGTPGSADAPRMRCISTRRAASWPPETQGRSTYGTVQFCGSISVIKTGEAENE